MTTGNQLATLDAVKKIVFELDESLTEDDDYFKSAVLLLAALNVGHDVQRLAEFTGFPAEFIETRK